MRTGIIGAGEMGQCLAEKFAAKGHVVALANSGNAKSVAPISAKVGAKASTVHDMLLENELVILSVPVKNIPNLPVGEFKALPENVIVVDTGNYYPTLRDGHISALERHGIDSLWAQEQLGVSVVKAFNAILATSLRDFAESSGNVRRIAIPISGGSKQAKHMVNALINSIGFDTFDAGGISDSWKHQPGSSIYCRDIPLKEMEQRAKKLELGQILEKRKSDEALMASDYPAYLKTLL